MHEGRSDTQGDIIGVTEEPPRALSATTVNFLHLALSMWARNAPEMFIGGLHWADALALAAHVTGKTYAPRAFAAASADLDVVRGRLREVRLAKGTSAHA